jgi:hypothetical protein
LELEMSDLSEPERLCDCERPVPEPKLRRDQLDADALLTERAQREGSLEGGDSSTRDEHTCRAAELGHGDSDLLRDISIAPQGHATESSSAAVTTPCPRPWMRTRNMSGSFQQRSRSPSGETPLRVRFFRIRRRPYDK